MWQKIKDNGFVKFLILPIVLLLLVGKFVMQFLASKDLTKEAQEKDKDLASKANEASNQADILKAQADAIENKIANNEVNEDWYKKK
jgi:Na+-transporting methylmalonyl-CoA/oxaloacetate decarboxylase gamma subunit